jgi:hypothetical protein
MTAINENSEWDQRTCTRLGKEQYFLIKAEDYSAETLLLLPANGR